MFRKTFFVLFSCAAISMACQTVEKANTNGANSSNVQANMPPGISSSPVTRITNLSGNAQLNPPKGATPTPGIPDLTVKTPTPKNTPPIPGIPSEAELKKQMNTPIANRSITERKPPVMESNSSNNTNDRPKKVRRP